MRPLKFKLDWLNGKSEEIQGTSFEDAFEKAGYSNKDYDNLQQWDQLDELPLIEKSLWLKGETVPIQIENPEVIRQIRLKHDLKLNSRIVINHARERLTLRVSRITETVIEFKEECTDNIKRIK